MCLSKTAHLYSLEDSLCLLSVKGSSELRMHFQHFQQLWRSVSRHLRALGLGCFGDKQFCCPVWSIFTSLVREQQHFPLSSSF